MSELVSTRTSLRARWSISALFLFCAAMTISLQAQTFTKLADLGPTTGEFPHSPLVQGLDGNLYGTTSNYGTYGGGTFFQITPSGTLTKLYDFCFNNNSNCPDGASPAGAVALGPDGNFYGTTLGSFTGSEFSTVYQITPLGSLTTLHTFCSSPNCSDGAFATPNGLTLAWNGDFYGTSFPQDGSSAYDNVVYAISSTGAFHKRLVVCRNQICPTDAGPSGTLLQSSAGYLIGPGPGGANGLGAIYKMTPLGTPTVIASMSLNDAYHLPLGSGTNAPMAQGRQGNLFTTNSYGGAGKNCTLSQGCGTMFYALQAYGEIRQIHDFCSWAKCADGATPNALILASEGLSYSVFFGTTSAGGATSTDGTVFQYILGNHYSVLHTFTGSDGSSPMTALVEGTDGNLYGTTSKGGANGGGVVFLISLGLPPFVKTVQPAGKVGDSIVILGNNLTGSTSVTFNGTAAIFTVVSNTEIIATVPTGATAGTIEVVTPGRTLSSYVSFPIHS